MLASVTLGLSPSSCAPPLLSSHHSPQLQHLPQDLFHHHPFAPPLPQPQLTAEVDRDALLLAYMHYQREGFWKALPCVALRVALSINLVHCFSFD